MERIFGVILVGPYNDHGWSEAHYNAGKYAEEGATEDAEETLSQALQIAQTSEETASKAQALIAIGNGGLTGLGWTQGTQNQLLFLRVRHTDFIFSVIAEELGMIGASFILLLLLFVVWRVLRIAERAPDQFGKLLATGVAALIFFQIVVNVGMNLKIMPVTGLTLPFISYGGSSLISMMFAIGLAESVAMRHRKIEFLWRAERGAAT